MLAKLFLLETSNQMLSSVDIYAPH